jgi:UDP-N-acetyl-D-mannosaminuronic acid transferase (WecB/TagA/CpsF family)
MVENGDPKKGNPKQASELDDNHCSARFRQILGVKFIIGSEEEVIREISRAGGLVVVPSAPVLASIPKDPRTAEALMGADYAIADSALMVLLWNVIERDSIPKLSGLKYIRALIEQPHFRASDANFWVMPTPQAAERNVAWLRMQGVQVLDENVYLAPFYGAGSEDPALLARLEERRPKHVIMGLGGGTQERIGLYLKRNLSYRPAIHCTGAAIAFLTGDQVYIPAWADELGLGWLIRCFSNPRQYGARYWEARSLAPMLLRYRDRLPSYLS